ncbi:MULTISPECIES: sensor histidine kinase [unclassified Streptosporangium]|uniref:sensor histidine kinase n=1 Tax=unclassified Streptosporangium TaxID=2632669 RepID=UPI002E2D4ED3|nr:MULTISPECIES: sensor domain-containing protein [unclassified Streptosporangium]
MSSATDQVPPRPEPQPRSRPGRVWRELGHTLAAPPLAVVGLLLILALLLAASWSTALVGLPMLAATVRGARYLGAVHLGLARLLLDVRTPAPAPFRPGPGPVGWFTSALGDDVGWRAAAYLLVKPLTALLALGTAAGFWGGGLLLLSYPARWSPVPIGAWGPHAGTWPGALLLGAAGLPLLALAPLALRVALLPERFLARALLGPTRTSVRVGHLEATRARMAEDSTATLRRIERDLHDGPQARLVALAMSLGMAKDELADNSSPEDRLHRARDLVDAAHRDTKEIIADLRLLIHGIYPPVLDQGLEVALATLVTRFALPVDLRVDLPRRPSAVVETIVYFCTAELLANVVRHSGARRAIVDVRGHDGLLRLHVGDDGTGGASVGPGTGLPGLAARVGVVDGRLEIDSPPGGPTVVTVEVPLPT